MKYQVMLEPARLRTQQPPYLRSHGRLACDIGKGLGYGIRNLVVNREIMRSAAINLIY